MPFGAITVNSKTYNPAQEGIYMYSGYTFGTGKDYFKISGAKRSKNSSALVCAVSRIVDIEIVSANPSSPDYRPMSCQLVISLPNNVTFVNGGDVITVADNAVADISSFLTSTTINRLLAGES